MHRLAPLTALLVFSAAASAQETLPPFAPGKGTTLKFDLTSSAKIGMGPVAGRSEVTLHTVVQVLDTDEKGTRLSITWQETHGEVVLPMLTTRFDSRQPVATPVPPGGGRLARLLTESATHDIRRPWEALVGFSYEVVVDRSGVVTDMPDLAKRLAERRKLVHQAGNEDTVNSFLDERTLRWHVGLMVPGRGGESSKAGDTWKTPATIGVGHGTLAVVDVEVRSELRTFAADTATIESAATPRSASPSVTAANAVFEGSLLASRVDGFAESGWRALDVELRHRGAARLLDQKVECDWTVRRVRD
ncbi:MAG: hypothetical protein JNK78_19890 [Planctomycetes bacterium]|nr:hypothetical protein [Planctomycetota bacterium]